MALKENMLVTREWKLVVCTWYCGQYEKCIFNYQIAMNPYERYIAPTGIYNEAAHMVFHEIKWNEAF